MTAWINTLVEFFNAIFNEIFMNMELPVGSTVTSLGGIIIAAIIVMFAISIFWKGAKK